MLAPQAPSLSNVLAPQRRIVSTDTFLHINIIHTHRKPFNVISNEFSHMKYFYSMYLRDGLIRNTLCDVITFHGSGMPLGLLDWRKTL